MVKKLDSLQISNFNKGGILSIPITFARLIFVFWLACALLLVPVIDLSAGTFKEAMENAAEYFVKQAVKIEPEEELYLGKVVNANSKEEDEIGKSIKNELYFALEKQTPDYKLLVGENEESTQGIVLSGSYQISGESITAKFRITKESEVLAQVEVEYTTNSRRSKKLVAVLDIEAKALNKTQQKAYSNIYRAALNDIGVFIMASAAEIDKMDPEMIQEATGCTRDTCATIIGEQLGVDRAISTSLFEVDKDMYLLSSKMMDIMDGAILVSKTVEHNGGLETLGTSLIKLAKSMTQKSSDLQAAEESEAKQTITLKIAMDMAAEYLVKEAIKIEPGYELQILDVVNYNNQKNDELGKNIETELYFALERQAPDFKLLLGKGDNEEKIIQLSGSYFKVGEKTKIDIKVTREMEILASYQVEYDTKAHRKTLVAVIDLEADTLNNIQRKAFSDVFRAELTGIDIFDIASSSDIDKLDPDSIQESTGCTRDACATIIGEQLGVDRVVSSSILEVSDGMYVISAKLMDIKDGSVLVSKTIEHSGDIPSLKRAMEKMAYALTGTSEESIKSAKQWQFIKHASAITLTLAAAVLSFSEADSYNKLGEENSDLESQYAQAVSQSQGQSILSEIDSNQEKMKTHKSNIQMLDIITLAAFTWELYLLIFDTDWSDEEEEPTESTFKFEIQPDLYKRDSARFSLVYRW
jgi:hypothetical protein